jgi:transposase
MLPTPGQPTKHDALGAVHDHTGATVVLCRRHKRRKEVAELLRALLEKHPEETVCVAGDNATTQEAAAVEALVRGAAGRLGLLDLPPDRPWLNPIEMLWRHLRREVTHGELLASVKALLAAAQDCFARYHQEPQRVLSSIGATPKNLSVCT